MPRFNKQEHELKSHFDKWLYFLKHLESFEEIPEILKEDVFMRGFKIAEIANFDEKQLAEYEKSLMYYRDLKGVVDTSFEEGKIEGRSEGKIEGKNEGKIEGRSERSIEIAKEMKKAGEPRDNISKFTGLSDEEIDKL